MKVVTVASRCDHCSRDNAQHEEQVGVFGKIYALDWCAECLELFSQIMNEWLGGSNIEVLGTFEGAPRAADPFGPLGTWIRPGVQIPVPQFDAVWWETPKNATSDTRKEFKDAREKMWAWGHEQNRQKGGPRFPGISESCSGSLPKQVGFAYTREVLLLEQEDDEPESEVSPRSEQALIPAPPKGRPRRTTRAR